MEAADRPEVCDTTSKTSSSDLQTNGKALQSTDTTTKKTEAKPVKSNKKLKEEEKKLSKSLLHSCPRISLSNNSFLSSCTSYFSFCSHVA